MVRLSAFASQSIRGARLTFTETLRFSTPSRYWMGGPFRPWIRFRLWKLPGLRRGKMRRRETTVGLVGICWETARQDGCLILNTFGSRTLNRRHWGAATSERRSPRFRAERTLHQPMLSLNLSEYILVSNPVFHVRRFSPCPPARACEFLHVPLRSSQHNFTDTEVSRCSMPNPPFRLHLSDLTG